VLHSGIYAWLLLSRVIGVAFEPRVKVTACSAPSATRPHCSEECELKKNVIACNLDIAHLKISRLQCDGAVA
jgi:hypothetical protein